MKKSETFEAALAKQQALQAEIAGVVKQLGGGGELQVLAVAAAQERTRADSFLAQHGGEERIPEAMRATLALYRQRAEDAASTSATHVKDAITPDAPPTAAPPAAPPESAAPSSAPDDPGPR